MKVIKLSAIFFLVICIAMLVAFPEIYVRSSFDGIKLWALVVLPTLLPFFFLTTALSSLGLIEKLSLIFARPMKHLFGTSGITAYAFISSVISGYPVGAKIICDLVENGIISRDEGTRASTFCSTSGPMFIIGSVGSAMFSDKKAGYILFIAHILSSIICGMIFRFYGKKENGRSVLTVFGKRQSSVLYECVYSSVISVAVVGGFISLFYLFADVAQNLKITFPIEFILSLIVPKEIASGFSAGLIECTRGCLALSKCGLSSYSLSCACSVISFGGISVWFQSIAFLSKAKTNVGVFALAKICQAVISPALCCLFFNLFF